MSCNSKCGARKPAMRQNKNKNSILGPWSHVPLLVAPRRSGWPAAAPVTSWRNSWERWPVFGWCSTAPRSLLRWPSSAPSDRPRPPSVAQGVAQPASSPLNSLACTAKKSKSRAVFNLSLVLSSHRFTIFTKFSILSRKKTFTCHTWKTKRTRKNFWTTGRGKS